MTGRHTVNTITSDALDELYADLDQARQHSAAIVRVRAELDRIEDFAKRRDDSTTVPYLDAVDALRTALDQPAPAATEATEPAAWTPPPPGDRREQLPDHLLDLIRGGMPDYTSTACVTAYALAVAVHWSHPRRAELGQWAARMHARCRLNHKFTGQPCTCGCHDGTAPANQTAPYAQPDRPTPPRP